MHLEKQILIRAEAQIEALLFDKALIIVPAKYFRYSNVFLVENAMELPEYIGMNNYTSKPEEGKQLFFSPIYSSKPVELETLKSFIEITLANNFI